MQEAFETIYRDNAWWNGSGEGSALASNRAYIAFLEGFMKEQGVKTVVDLGCGDWQFSSHVDWSGVDYTGLDLVESVIARNTREFSRPNVRFHRFSGDWAELPDADLLIAKDVLQHWSNATIRDFLPTLGRYRHALITNCVGLDGAPDNADIADGSFRCLDIRRAPFNVAASEKLTYSNIRRRHFGFGKRTGWRKIVLSVGQDEKRP